MAVESYEQIMARLQGQQAQAPTAASDFANYVQTLLLNPNPQGNMMTDAEAYRADPFRRQNAINANLDAALKKKQMEEEAARAAAAGGGMGMMSSGGESSMEQGIDPAVAAYLDAENMGARGVRNNAAMNVLGSLVAGYPMGGTSGALGTTDSMGFTTAGRMNQMAYQYNKTPDFLKPYLPQSYANAAGYINQSDSVFNPMNPNGNVNMGVQQAAMLAAQDEGLFDTPEERAAWYSDNSGGGDSGGGGGGYSGPSTAAEAGYSGDFM